MLEIDFNAKKRRRRFPRISGRESRVGVKSRNLGRNDFVFLIFEDKQTESASPSLRP